MRLQYSVACCLWSSFVDTESNAQSVEDFCIQELIAIVVEENLEIFMVSEILLWLSTGTPSGGVHTLLHYVSEEQMDPLMPKPL